MSDNSSVPLPSLNWDAVDQMNAYEEWYDFMNSYFVIKEVSDDKRYHYILLSAGHKGHELWKSWNLSEDERKNPRVVFDKFKDHMIGTVNKWVMRLELSNIIQKETEPVDDFICRIKAKANLCKFSNNTVRDEQICFQLIKGVKWPEERKNLIKKGNDLKLDEAIKSVQCFQATIQNVNSFTPGYSTSVGAVKTNNCNSCSYCGTSHPPRKCPAFGKKCAICNKENHFASMCKTKKSVSFNKKQNYGKNVSKKNNVHRKQFKNVGKNVHNIDIDELEENVLDCGEIIVSVNECNVNGRQSIMAKLNAKPKDVAKRVTLTVKADTGANGNILPLRCLKQMYVNEPDPCSRLKHSLAKLTAVNATDIKNLGSIDIPLQFDKSEWTNCRFFVSDISSPPILSCDLSEKLGIIKVSRSKLISVVNNCCKQENVNNDVLHDNVCIRDKETLKELYPSCFTGIGHFQKKYKIELQSNAIPVVSPHRNYPVPLREEICRKLEEIEKLGVVSKCADDEPYEWINSLAFSRKDSGELRVCLDPRALNKYIKRTYHKIPTLDEISHELVGATVFSKLDAKHGYWSIELDEESSKLCTFNSPVGKYRFCRLPFGLCVSQDIFQKYMDDILRKAGKGMIGIADDVVVFGKTVKEHNDALHRLMKAAREFGLVFRYEKCSILVDCIKFYGFVWSKDGMKPDLNKCDDICNRPAPKNRAELQSFLGLIQYLSSFIPHLSEKTYILRQLLKHNVDWEWNAEHQQAFEILKKTVHGEMTLTYFDPNQPVEIEVDASLIGLGAALVQCGKPIAFASKALTPTESRYANIERELLAVVFGLEKFHTYVFGKPLIVFSDHKPLENINKKPLSMAPPRLQRMLLRIQPYDVEIDYRPGKNMIYADYLSRVGPTPGPNIKLEQAIHMIQISVGQLEKLRLASQQDPELSILREQIVSGWPEQSKLLPKIIRSYWTLRDYLSVEDGLIYNGHRLVIPESFRKEYLDRVHAGHQGVTKSQLRAKDSIYWSNMMSDIEKTVRDCEVCLQNAKSSKKEPMKAHDIPSQPWEVVSSDLFELDGHSYILLVDHFSKMPFVRGLKTTNCNEVIKFFKDMFAIHGVPKRLYSDNGPQYSACNFKNFCNDWDFEHITSSPHYPQSNGFVERMVGIVKSVLKKAKQAGNDPQMALLCLRSTPLDSRTPSPAELLYGRKIRSNLPAKNNCNLSNLVDHESLLNKSETIAKYYNQHAGSELSELLPGMSVLVQKPDEQSWTPGIIKEKCKEPRSYFVEMSNGSVLRRNRRFLKEVSPNVMKKFNMTRNYVTDDNASVSQPSIENMSDNKVDIEEQPESFNLSVRPKTNLPVHDADPPAQNVFTPRRSSRNIKKPSRLIEYCE